jgi:carbamoylphosphate synthase large subunit
MTKDELVKAVKAHAVANYETGGWDYLVECYSDTEVAELIGGARTVKGAIKKVAKVMGIKNDYREDIQATAW